MVNISHRRRYETINPRISTSRAQYLQYLVFIHVDWELIDDNIRGKGLGGKEGNIKVAIECRHWSTLASQTGFSQHAF